ncbi:GAF domain-containing protein, partial [Streptomyces sp. T21Q-yed]
MPHDGRSWAGFPELRASEAGAADIGAPPPVPEVAAIDRVLRFAGAALVAVYVPGAGEEELRLTETVGCAISEYGLPERLPVSGGSPAAYAFRTGRPLWLNPPELASYPEGGPMPPRAELSLGALPLGSDGRRLGCL